MRRGRRTLDNQVRAEDTHSADTNTGLGGAVCGTETREDDGRGAAHRAEEGLSSVSIVLSAAHHVGSARCVGWRWEVRRGVATGVWRMSSKTYGIDGAAEVTLAFVHSAADCAAPPMR
jgi:hypothetical protein